MIMWRILLLLFILPEWISSCNPGNDIPDISGINVDIRIKRFEKDLFSADPARIDDLIPVLKDKYGRFFRIFNLKIIRIGPSTNPQYPELLKLFVTDRMNFEIYEKTDSVFPDLGWLEDELDNGFAYYRYYFPGKKVPQINTYIGGFNQSVVSDSGLLAIGLDKYLGTGEKMYDELGVYSYMKMNMHKEKIASDCMRLWAETEFEYNDSVNTLISQMIYEGMVMVFVDRMLPEQPDTLKWGFTSDQMKFCMNNEKQMWTYLIENRLIFNSDKFTIDKFIQEGPFTKDFTSESPARAAVWIGYNLVKSYLKQKPGLTLKALMHEKDYQKILNQSHYSP